jgi:hypothetical protein
VLIIDAFARLAKLVEQQENEETGPAQVAPPEGELFAGGPKITQIDSWKKQFEEVFATELGDDVFVWRPLGRHEYKFISAQPNTDPLMREEMIAETCVLWPISFGYEMQARTKAGVVSTIVDQIMEASHFTRTSVPQRL